VNPEQLEHELTLLHNKIVVVVRPGYGTQSDSWGGMLTVLNGDYPPKFHFAGVGMAILFSVEDVRKLDDPTNETREVSKIIRLKGPHDYEEAYQATNA
jgi:hypothetical protein